MKAYLNFSTHLSSWYLGSLVSKVPSLHRNYLIKVSIAFLLYFLETSDLYFEGFKAQLWAGVIWVCLQNFCTVQSFRADHTVNRKIDFYYILFKNQDFSE